MALEEEDEQQSKRMKALDSSETSEDPQSVPTIPPEIIVQILSKLPVESLLRCRRIFINFKSCPLYDAICDKSDNSVVLDYPLESSHKVVFWIAGICNGLLLIATVGNNLLIWNPSTRRSNMLPYGGFKGRPDWYVLFGFGYVESTDDYKVVGISCGAKSIGTYDFEVKIYSLKAGNWKTIGGFPHVFPISDFGKFSNGALHWAATKNIHPSYTWILVSLDLAKETYGEVLQPKYDEGDHESTLGILGESLCVLCNYRGIRADVWVMKVYGVKDSWTKLVSIPYLTDPRRVTYTVPLCISNDGKILLRFGWKFVLYDFKNSSFSEIQNHDQCHVAYIFVESLVSPYAL